MDDEKDSFELELERENEGYELVLENDTEEIVEKSKIKRIKKLPKVQPEIKVDFDSSEVNFYVIIPKTKLIDANEKERKQGYLQVETIEYSEKFVFKKKFDFVNNRVVMDEKTYEIPFYFNSDLINKKDENTWERLFYRIFYNHIINELKKYNN